MPLCELCGKINFANLPSFPEWLPSYHIPSGVEKELVPFVNFGCEMPPEGVDALGIPHHQSLEDLLAAARTCELCNLISKGLNRVMEARKRHMAIEKRRYFDKCGDPTGKLWICARREEQQGFVVMSPAESLPDIFMVSGIGFCVEDGMWLILQDMLPGF